MAEGGHLFAAAQRLWLEMRNEFKEPCPDSELAEGVAVQSEELKKVGKWIQHGVTKFGASASVAEGEERDKGLKPIADEVIKSFTAAIGTLLSLKRGAGATLIAELHATGAGLASALDALGKAVGTSDMATCAGKVLAQVKTLERTSMHNRMAIRRRLLQNLSQLRDAQRELQESLDSDDQGGDDDDDDDDDFFDSPDAALEPAERVLVEALVKLAGSCVDVLAKVSTACGPSKEDGLTPAGISALEVAVMHSTVAAGAMDGLAVAANGGLDPDEFSKSLAEMDTPVTGLLAFPVVGEDSGLRKVFSAVDAAFKAAVAADTDS